MRTTSGRFRALASPRSDEEWVFVSLPEPDEDPDAHEYEPTFVADSDALGDVVPGALVSATLDWEASPPTVSELAVERATRYRFVPETTNLFEAAQDAWAEAVTSGSGMNSTVLRDTDGEETGVCYVFGDSSGELFAGFERGTRPIEPLVLRVNRSRDDDGVARSVFVLDPVGDPFVAVAVAFDREGLLARTMRDTYLDD
ncbi:DUF6663 family protein [Haloarchaeobius sp. FL176]|uniref:DUF6663 family protein n=1 Tax=Haloarchaeobius sp. FL176 TaxID=2967129 RepID=UPI002148733A|nr:DUF6663 family protein [Haloarchaeobius sp. FL176]